MGTLGLHQEVESPVNGVGVKGGAPSNRLLQDLKSGQSLMGDRKDREKSPAWCVHYGSLVESVSTYQQVILTHKMEMD